MALLNGSWKGEGLARGSHNGWLLNHDGLTSKGLAFGKTKLWRGSWSTCLLTWMLPGSGTCISNVPTGCVTVTVLFDTPFSRTYVGAAGCPFTWWSGIVADLIFWKKILKFFFGSGSGPGTSPAWFSGSAWFWAWSSSCYPWVFNFLAWKPLRMVNLTLKIHFWGQVYHVKWFSGQKVEYP